ncbi:MAG TPA: OadG family protein [Bacteroidales bacterium]|nr:OadG family protein [Bacteroidales bacterium]
MNLLSAISVYGQVFDSITWIIVFVGISIVFLALLIIYLFFRYVLTFILNFRLKSFARKKGIDSAEIVTARTMMTGEVNAAIAMALFMYFNEMHDVESGIVTIKRVSKNYSPWSSKLYNMKNI